jgi:hypothetical protein
MTGFCGVYGPNVIEKAGQMDGNPLHVGVVLQGEWRGAVTGDGGRSWQAAEPAQLTNNLASLATNGVMRYLVADTNLLLRSDDEGRTWINVSPWIDLKRKERDELESEKKRFKIRYGHWLRKDESWPLSFAVSAVVLVGLAGWRYSKSGKGWIAPALISLAAYCLLGGALFGFNLAIYVTYNSIQWESPDGVLIPLWPLGMMMQLTGNVWLAPLAAAICFPMTSLWSCLMFTRATPHRNRIWLFVGAVLSTGLILWIIAVSALRIGHGWAYEVPEENVSTNSLSGIVQTNGSSLGGGR